MINHEEDRFRTLEGKVDRIGDIFQKIATNQELMQQELRMMNNTLNKVEDLHTKLTQCSVACHLGTENLKHEMYIHITACNEADKALEKKFETRDKVLLSLATGTVLSMVATILQHITK